MKCINISNREISDSAPTFIIAELSANHNQQFEVALETIKAAKAAGADAIKLQTYTADTITLDSPNECFQIKHGTLWDGKTLHQLYKEAYTPWDWQPKLKEIAEDLGLICFSSPFDKTSVDFLEKMAVPAYKIASLEITDIPLIEYVASKGKPIIISTGVATLTDIEEAVNACKRAGNDQIALLKCTSTYPTPFEDVNLRTIPNLAETFDTVVGLSDHTPGIAVPIAAVTLGARIVEKHFILDKTLGGPDATFSLEPQEFKQMVQNVRNAEQALGRVNYHLSEKAKGSRKYVRSLFVVEDMKAGDMLTVQNIRSIRPGNGLSPKYLNQILGMKAKIDLDKGNPLSWIVIDQN
jgi:pseudaminic acid synthase